MGDCWDYTIRKVEMAWQLVQEHLKDRRQRVSLPINTEDYYAEVQAELQRAWDTVNAVFPGHADRD